MIKLAKELTTRQLNQALKYGRTETTLFNSNNTPAGITCRWGRLLIQISL